MTEAPVPMLMAEGATDRPNGSVRLHVNLTQPLNALRRLMSDDMIPGMNSARHNKQHRAHFVKRATFSRIRHDALDC